MTISNLSALSRTAFACACGKTHCTDIQHIVIRRGALDALPDIAASFASGTCFVVADSITYAVAGQSVADRLTAAGHNVRTHVFNTPDLAHPLVPNEAALGRLVVEMPVDTSLIVAVGSGSLGDAARMLSAKTKVPYIIVATAPSMDGYASTVSPLIIDGCKVTYEAVYPYAIVADVDILCTAPDMMLQAGFGDIIGKYTALTDWALSHAVNGEYICPHVIGMVQNAIRQCADHADGLAKRDASAVAAVMEGLVLSGLCMGMIGNSRPASGAEHHLSHYWEVDALANHKPHALHGNAVGVATLVSATLYDISGVARQYNLSLPTVGEIRTLLQRAGSATTPSALGIDRELFRRSVLHALEIRPRYTILLHLHNGGTLERCADAVTRMFYDEV